MAHVLQAWVSMQQCSKVRVWGSDWIMRALPLSVAWSTGRPIIQCHYCVLVETWGGRALLEKQLSRGRLLKDVSCPWPLPASFCFLPAINWVTLSSTHPRCRDILPHLQPKAMDPTNLALKSLKLWGKINLSSFSLSVTATKSLTQMTGKFYLLLDFWETLKVLTFISLIRHLRTFGKLISKFLFFSLLSITFIHLIPGI